MLLCCLLIAASFPAAYARTRKATAIVADIKKADYAGDRAALVRLYNEIAPLTLDAKKEKKVIARIHYWRGFAMWRNAQNGFNEMAAPQDLEQQTNLALIEFGEASRLDPNFVDAKIATASCLGNLAFLNRNNPEKMREYISRYIPLMQQAHEQAPDNPRWYWVQGPAYWSMPAEHGGGQDKAFAAYEKGMDAIQKQKPVRDPLEPSWGKAELLMNIAWSNLHRTTPDLKTADRYAHEALKLVPTWHYVRDILLPQIKDAQIKEVQCPTLTDGLKTLAFAAN